MKRYTLNPILLAASYFFCLLMLPVQEICAATVAFQMEIRAGIVDTDFGTGVSSGDTFVGTIYFDSSDLMTDGAKPRTILPGGDSLSIAGVSFDSLMNSTFWSFNIVGGLPVCFDTGIGGGCGTGTSQINFDDASNPYPSISFTDTFSGTAFDQDQLAIQFNYSINPVLVPIPGSIWLFISGLFGLAHAARRKKAS